MKIKHTKAYNAKISRSTVLGALLYIHKYFTSRERLFLCIHVLMPTGEHAKVELIQISDDYQGNQPSAIKNLITFEDAHAPFGEHNGRL